MSKNKQLKALSIEELENKLKDLDNEEEKLEETKKDKLLDYAIDDEVSKKRQFKDLCCIAYSLFSFQASNIFLAHIISKPDWLNYVLAGTCFANAILGIVMHRIGFEKDKKKHYEKIKKYFEENPNEIEKIKDQAPRFDEDVRLTQIEKEYNLTKKYLKMKRENDTRELRIVENTARIKEEQ